MKLISSIIIVFLAISGFSQEEKYGEISKEDFEATALSGQKDPDAIVLYRKDHTRFNIYASSLMQTNEVHERILIKNEEGLKYATEKIALYNKSKKTKDRLKKVKAASYNLIDGEIVETKFRRRDMFEEDINEFWKSESFTIPGAAIGSIVEFAYEKTSPLPSIDDKIVQYDIPINELDMRIQTFEYYIYNTMINPEAPYMISLQRSTENNPRINLDNLATNDPVITMSLKGVPALEDEPMSGNKERYRAKLLFEFSGTRWPRRTIESFSNTWEEVSKTILERKNFGDQLKSTKYFRKDLEKSVESTVLDIETASEVLSFLRSKVKWNGHYGKYVEKGTKDAYKDGSGNAADMNLMLVAMLKEKGFNAYPVLISSRNNGIPLFSTLDGFDYVISEVEINNKVYLVDATEPYSTFNVLPQRAAHWQGRVLKSADDSEWVDLTPNSLSKDIIMIEGEFDEDFNIKFKTNRRLTDQMALSMRNRLTDLSSDDVEKYLEGDVPGLQVTSHKAKNVDDYHKPLNLKYEGIFESGVDKVGDKIYITPLLYDMTDENPFKLEKRKFPVDLSFPMETTTIVNMKIPEGYEVVSIPTSTKSIYDEGVGTYTYRVAQNDKIISTVATFQMNKSKIMPQEYTPFRDFFISIVDKDAEKIVLQKKP